jgi:NhaP-type Na+/H+ or K+/H+ antiporter
MGYGMDLKMITMMTWGGLRGAVGLALALMVQLEVGTSRPSPVSHADSRHPPRLKFETLVVAPPIN